MPSVIGGIALCASPRSLVCDEQGVGKFPLWRRYEQLMTIIAKYIPEKYQSFLAKPVEVVEPDDKHLVWYAQTSVIQQPIRLTQLSPDEQTKYEQIKNEYLFVYRTAVEKCKSIGENNDAEHIEKALKYVGDFNDYFYCFDEKVVVVVWGMRPRNLSDPMSGIVDKLLKPNVSHTAKFDLGEFGFSSDTLVLRKRPTDLPIQAHQIPNVHAKEGYEFVGWDVDPLNFKVDGDVVFTAQYASITPPPPQDTFFNIRFEDELGNELASCKVKDGDEIPQNIIPSVPNKEHFRFVGWGNDLQTPVHEDRMYKLRYKEIQDSFFNIRFEDELGNELASCKVKDGDVIPQNIIPSVPNKDHFRFVGWGSDLQTPVHEDRTYKLRYEEVPLSWWERFKRWWKEKGCLKWLLRLLLLLILLLLLLFLLRQCNGGGCSRKGPNPPVSNYDGHNPFIPTDPGNGGGNTPGTSPNPFNPNNPGTPGNDIAYPPIAPNDPGREFLPEEPNKPIPIDDGDIIDDEDNYRRIVANRLNVLLDDENLMINEFAVDFKNAYPGEQYQIIYADPLIKRLQLQVPSDERVQIKQELISKLPEKYTQDNVFIWDEALMNGTFVPDDSRIGECWYHNAIKTYAAWDVSMGKEDIVIAVLDDGFDLSHDEFKDKIVKPYNVFDKSTNVSESKDKHGTHVAGLAVAIANNQKGIAGVAPNCKLMPVKVFDDNGHTSVLPVLDGVLYAMYNGADVVNLSLGLALQANIPIPVQQELIRSYFKEEERVWKKVFSMTDRNNTAIVIAAGNENLLAGIEPMHRSESVIVVAAVDEEHNPLYNKCNFSNYGPYTDVSAPGLNIVSTIGRNKYAVMSGTSMAAPIVTGAVALVKSVNRPLSTPQIKKILQETGIAVNGNVGPLIQLDKALEKARSTDANTIDTHPEPSSGSVQVLLEWHNHNDLDLICKDPTGEVVWYKQKHVPSGGQLEIDMNAGNQFSSNPIENIYWPQGGAPVGEYLVGVLYYKRHDTNEAHSDFKVTVRSGDKERTFKGTAQNQGEVIGVCSFTFE